MHPSILLLSTLCKWSFILIKHFIKSWFHQKKINVNTTQTNTVKRNIWMSTLFPVEKVWELGDFNSWTGLILETTSHLYKKKSTHLLHFTPQMREVGGQLLRPLWEQKGLNWIHSRGFSFPFHSLPLEHPFSFIVTLLSLISSFPSYIQFPLRFQKPRLWNWALPPTGQLILDKSLHLSKP